MSGRRLIVGLGNPGPEYAAHRHNVGFLVLDELARRRGVTFVAGAGPWTAATDTDGDLVLLRPLTFMNRSGQAVAGWARAEDPGAEADTVRPLVVCDDLALPLGSVRLRARGSSGGQNGLESVITALDHEEFPRLRLGIAPLVGEVPPADWPDFVLAPFAPDETEAAGEMVRHAADALECWLAEGFEAAGSRFNRRVRPPVAED